MSFKVIRNIIKSVKCPLSKTEKELLHRLKSSTLTDNAYYYYIKNIRNNETDSKELAHKKLIRNIVLAQKAPLCRERPEREMYYMGNLSILYMADTNEIVWLDNKEGYYPFKVDAEKKQWLNEELGINTYKEAKVG